jgi:Flp pilus assembly pilin Flp
MSWLRELVSAEDGQDLIEYGLLAAFISLAVVASIDAVGGSLSAAYGSFKTQIDGFNTP